MKYDEEGKPILSNQNVLEEGSMLAHKKMSFDQGDPTLKEKTTRPYKKREQKKIEKAASDKESTGSKAKVRKATKIL